MNLTRETIKLRLADPLPGIDSHLKMAPKNRAEELLTKKDEIHDAKKSAVMILFFHDDNGLKMIVIRRSIYVGIHSGQIAFPGGRYEDEDGSVQITALREIEEEIGIARDKIEVLGRLSDIYVPPSNFLISVFVGYLAEKPQYKMEEREVAEIIEIPFAEFFKKDVIKLKDFYVNSEKVVLNAPYFDIANAEVWGASAMVISELLSILNL